MASDAMRHTFTAAISVIMGVLNLSKHITEKVFFCALAFVASNTVVRNICLLSKWHTHRTNARRLWVVLFMRLLQTHSPDGSMIHA